MKTKLEMAHDYAMLHMMNTQYKDVDDLEMIQWAFDYADAMKAEADKRNNKETCDKNIGLDSSVLKEWQPDWSQAPDDACCWFIGGSSWDLKAYWSKYIPCYKSETTQTTWQGNGMIEAPSFNYQGDWRDSLRKRPN